MDKEQGKKQTRRARDGPVHPDCGPESSLHGNEEVTDVEGYIMSDKVLPLADLAEQINTKHAQVCGAVCEGMEHPLACGRLLLQVKDRLPRDQWRAWLAEHCPDISESRAQRYMRVAGAVT
jgi:hypothetical protein